MNKLEKLKRSLNEIKPLLETVEKLKKGILKEGEDVRSYYKYYSSASDDVSECIIVDIANEYYVEEDGIDILLELIEELEEMDIEG